ncbi:dihydroxyacetone kinase subunit DhaL [Brachybacterium phenoliresistens]|uniref:dihydroxyacetone kinase subunit DhaL n=1 Tax=Brachybacterium phenoliresistens TaxID=396014 RepID=UPI0031D67F54
MTTSLDGIAAHAWITEFQEAFDRSQQRLGDLDRLAGDGDFGTNIASALRRVSEALPTAEGATFRSVFTAVSRGFLATGGTSGPLFGMWFRSIGRAADAEATTLDLADGVHDGLERITALGGAKVGDSTMVDALDPAAAALHDAACSGLSAADALAAAARAAREGARSTGELIAQRGRASYVGELARGVLDPGAVTIALFFEAGARSAGSTEPWGDLLGDGALPDAPRTADEEAVGIGSGTPER